jgi:hypothetical protein
VSLIDRYLAVAQVARKNLQLVRPSPALAQISPPARLAVLQPCVITAARQGGAHAACGSGRWGSLGTAACCSDRPRALPHAPGGRDGDADCGQIRGDLGAGGARRWLASRQVVVSIGRPPCGHPAFAVSGRRNAQLAAWRTGCPATPSGLPGHAPCTLLAHMFGSLDADATGARLCVHQRQGLRPRPDPGHGTQDAGRPGLPAHHAHQVRGCTGAPPRSRTLLRCAMRRGAQR